MDADESLLTTLGMADAMPPLPDDVWERALSIALDPTTPDADADLVPDMDDIPVVPDESGIFPDDDGEIVLDDDIDAPVLGDDGGEPGDLHGDTDAQDLDEAGDIDIDSAFFDQAATADDVTTGDLPDLGLDDTAFGDGDLY